MAREVEPDIAILDYSLPELNGRDLTVALRKELPKIEVLIYSMHDREELVSRPSKRTVPRRCRSSTFARPRNWSATQSAITSWSHNGFIRDSRSVRSWAYPKPPSNDRNGSPSVSPVLDEIGWLADRRLQSADW